MLVLTRRSNEAIQIGDDVEVKIISVDGEQVKIGINAPKDLDVHRKEIYMAIQAENTAAAILPSELPDPFEIKKQ